jgi:hypothetical protein
MGRREKVLFLYRQRSDLAPLAWSWVDRQLTDAGTYWVVGQLDGRPHPRPVWGVWQQERLHLSIGSPTVRRAIEQQPAVTVHLDSGTDVVIVEGLVAPAAATAPSVLEAYNRKYDYDYQVGQFGELTTVLPGKVLAWRAAGWAGRDSFQQTGSWTFD